MKKAALFFLLVLMLQNVMLMNCFGDVGISDNLLLADLTQLSSYESKQQQEILENKAVVLSRLLDAEKNLNDRLMRIQAGDAEAIKALDRDSLLRIVQYNNVTFNPAFIFNDAIFEEYRHIRLASLNKLRTVSTGFDRTTFLKAGPGDFEGFLKQIESKAEQSLKLTLLLQDKLMDKAKEEDLSDKDAYFEEVLALRLPQNKSKLQNIAYQMLESRARLEMLEQVVRKDCQLIRKSLRELRIKVYSSDGGSLAFNYLSVSNPVEVKKYAVYVPAGKGMLSLPLDMLVMIDGDVRFQGKKEAQYSLTGTGLLDAIQFDADKRFFIDLDAAASKQAVFQGELNTHPISELENQNNPNGASTAAGTKPVLPVRMKEAGMIMKELKRYEIYLTAKRRGIGNTYTNMFAQGLSGWKTNLSHLLRGFKPVQAPKGSGMPEYYLYIRQYTDSDSRSVLQLREQALQYMDLKEGCLWIMDMLYRIKYD